VRSGRSATSTGTTASLAALHTGASEVVLFTELDNQTSNTLYERLGFRPVADRVVLALRDPDVAALQQSGNATDPGSRC